MNRNTWIAVAISVFVVGFFFLSGPIMEMFQSEGPEAGSIQLQPLNMETNSALVIEDQNVGEGEEATVGALVTVHYVGTLENGIQFDSSRDRGEPFQFTLGQGSVIAGWEQGILGMKVGSKRRLVIPPALGYGENQVGPIPPNSTLIFEVELLNVEK
jgi:FKBP-type peptidyl-prolyl cis-trans isomerase